MLAILVRWGKEICSSLVQSPGYDSALCLDRTGGPIPRSLTNEPDQALRLSGLGRGQEVHSAVSLAVTQLPCLAGDTAGNALCLRTQIRQTSTCHTLWANYTIILSLQVSKATGWDCYSGAAGWNVFCHSPSAACCKPLILPHHNHIPSGQDPQFSPHSLWRKVGVEALQKQLPMVGELGVHPGLFPLEKL